MLLTRRASFSASHRTDSAEARGVERDAGPAAARVHGHNYVVEVTVAGSVDEATGMLMDLKELKDVLDREVISRFDHRNLDVDTPYFRGRASTAENVATVIFELLDAALPPGRLCGVRLSPTEDLCVEVRR